MQQTAAAVCFVIEVTGRRMEEGVKRFVIEKEHK
jgi:hypothetical protein